LKILGKLALPLLIISTLFAGIKAGFEKYQETGNFGDAIVSGLGGMLEFLTFGLLGEDTLKQVFDSLSGVFQPVLDTVSNIFDSIKGFFKGIFGDTVDVKEVSSGGAKGVTPKLPEGGKIGGAGGEADKAGAQLTSKATEMGVPEGTIPKGIFGDMGSVIDAGNSGGFGAMISAGEDLKKKYPSKAGPGAETPEQQAARNYELNIPYGNYNFNTLQSTIYSIGIVSITMSLDINTNKISFTDFNDSIFYIDKTSTLLSVLGGNVGDAYYNYQHIIKLPYQCNFNGVNNINIYMSNINTKNVESYTKTNCPIIQSIQVFPYAPQIIFNKTNDYSFTIAQKIIDYIQIDIKDDLGRFINFNNASWNLTLCFTLLKEIPRNTSKFSFNNSKWL
jgi:hypothetical protein